MAGEKDSVVQIPSGTEAPPGFNVTKLAAEILRSGFDLQLPMPAHLCPLARDVNIPAGLHMLGSKTAGGKSTLIRAMHLWALHNKKKSYYGYFGEPRAPNVAELFIQGGWSQVFTRMLEIASGGLLFVDSLTYMLGRLDEMRGLDVDRVTYKEGLTLRDIVGVLLHDGKAHAHSVALIAAVNMDLVPRTGALEGACEGSMVVDSFTSLQRRDRETRTWQTLRVPERFVRAARKDLGYPERFDDAADARASNFGGY